MTRLSQAPRALMAALYGVAAFLVLAPFLYEAQRILPLRPGDLDWRFGAAGFVLTAITTPVFGFGLAAVLAWAGGQRQARRAVSVLTLLFTGLCALTAIGFLRDLGPSVSAAPEAVRPVLRMTAVRTLVGSGTALLALVVLGIGGWRAGRDLG